VNNNNNILRGILIVNLFVKINKFMFLVLFAVFTVNLFVPFAGAAGQWIMWIGLAVLGVHLLELVVVYKKLQAGGHLSIQNILWILVAGILHWKPLLRE
jgi:uncharacterized protein YhhL (DUF1145 family)